MQTFAVILVCTIISALFGIPIGIAMSKYNRLQKAIIPVLDLLQTLPTFVYLIPPDLPLSHRRVAALRHRDYSLCHCAGDPPDRPWRPLVDKDVVEAGNAFGMSPRQKLTKVELPLALPNIMAGLNQTIMMSLAMVVIASHGHRTRAWGSRSARHSQSRARRWIEGRGLYRSAGGDAGPHLKSGTLAH